MSSDDCLHSAESHMLWSESGLSGVKYLAAARPAPSQSEASSIVIVRINTDYPTLFLLMDFWSAPLLSNSVPPTRLLASCIVIVRINTAYPTLFLLMDFAQLHCHCQDQHRLSNSVPSNGLLDQHRLSNSVPPTRLLASCIVIVRINTAYPTLFLLPLLFQNITVVLGVPVAEWSRTLEVTQVQILSVTVALLPVAEWSKTLDFGSELEIPRVQNLSVTVALFISTIDLVLTDQWPMRTGRIRLKRGLVSPNIVHPTIGFVTDQPIKRLPDLIKQNKGESRYSTRSMVLIKRARVTDRIRTCAISNSDSKVDDVLDRSAIGTPTTM
ncbi:hypothetical protein J6590_029895 [Homalodisca vitripennis]|nr:hypothetical protein J6590_029895 [Homalodisca vitripennis]